MWAVEHAADARLIGFCGLCPQTIEGTEHVELGYRFDPAFWGRGLATEAARACCTLAFGQLGLGHLIAIIEAENLASIRVAEKCGMRHERDATFHELPVRVRKRAVREALRAPAGGDPADSTHHCKGAYR